jgi:hypothetical protein
MLRHRLAAGRTERRQGDVECEAQCRPQRAGGARKGGRFGLSYARFHAVTLA